MLEVKYSTKFKRDLKVCQKRHYDMADYDLPAMQGRNEAQPKRHADPLETSVPFCIVSVI